jgi:hypothetical protein
MKYDNFGIVQKALIIACDNRFENTMGIIITHKAAQAIINANIKIFLLSSGPIIWLSILTGFIENSSLPVGAGKNGE